MKKTTIILSLSSIFASSVFAIDKPQGYNNLSVKEKGISSYISSNSKFIAIDCPTGKFKLDFSSVGEKDGKNEWGHTLYERNSIDYYYNELINPYAVLNGQFFAKYTKDKSMAAISFPLKGNGIAFQDKETDIKDEDKKTFKYSKKTLYMFRGHIPVIMTGFHKKYFDMKVFSDVITGLNPNVNNKVFMDKIKSTENIGRNYIGCIPYKKYDYGEKLAICKNLLFLYSSKATHNEMITEMQKWGIKNNQTIVMDASGSAQLYSKKMSGTIEKYGTTSWHIPDYRDLPSVIAIHER